MLSTFSKNIITYCFLQKQKKFVLIITPCRGWGIISSQNVYFLMKERKTFFFLSYLKSYVSFLATIFLGFKKGYFQYLKLKGMGYKFINTSNNIIIKFGFSHRQIYINFIDTKCKFITKFLLRLEARSFFTIKKIVHSFISSRKKNVYKKKGIFLKGSLIDIRVSSKKSKF